jgi:hypothetical protein
MKKITQFITKQDYYVDKNGFLFGPHGKMKSNTIQTIDGTVTRTKDKWYCIVYLGAPTDIKFYTKKNKGKLNWSLKADKTFLNLNSYVPEIDDNRPTYIYYLCDSRDGIPRYVGKTIDMNARYHGHLYDGKKSDSHKAKWIRKVLKCGGEVEMVQIDQTNPDGTLGSGDWTKLENFWAQYLKSLGFPIILDGGWGNGGSKRKLTQEEIIKQQNLQAKVSGVKTYVYNVYDFEEYVFNSCTSAERFLVEKGVRKSSKSQLSRKLSFVGSDFLVSKGNRLTPKQINNKLLSTKQIKNKVLQVDSKGLCVNIFESCRDAMRIFGTSVSSVLDKNKPHKTAYGYKWVYLKDRITSTTYRTIHMN